jgi:hypothetical protein
MSGRALYAFDVEAATLAASVAQQEVTCMKLCESGKRIANVLLFI